MKNLQFQKITQTINYLLRKSQGNSLNKLHLMKLIWAADRYHMRKFGQLVTGDSYVAMPKGPVASLSLDVINADDFLSEDDITYSSDFIQLNRSNHQVVSRRETDENYLSQSDREALDFAWSHFGSTDRYEMVNLTHCYPEWKKHEPVLSQIKTSVPIDLRDFFDNPDDISSDPFEQKESLLQANKEAFINASDFKQIFQ